jgi:hypothetical protein
MTQPNTPTPPAETPIYDQLAGEMLYSGDADTAKRHRKQDPPDPEIRAHPEGK